MPNEASLYNTARPGKVSRESRGQAPFRMAYVLLVLIKEWLTSPTYFSTIHRYEHDLRVVTVDLDMDRPASIKERKYR
jgi:hypothetical protein